MYNLHLINFQIKTFIKSCRNANYNRKLKQVLEKINQNSEFIENERSKLTININEDKKIEGWEAQIKNKGTPIDKFFESWNKLRTIKKNKMLTNNEELGDYKLPTINKVRKSQQKNSEGPVELFPSDSEEEVENIPKPRKKREGKKLKKHIADESGPVADNGEKDIVEDINPEDW